MRASGGVIFWSTVFTTFPTSPGVVLFSGDSAWSSLSDVNAKEHFTDLAGEDVLAKLAAMPGHEVYKLTPEQLDAWRKAVAPVEADWGKDVKDKTGLDPKVVLDGLKQQLVKYKASM